jgi:hypothetical protein
MSVLIIAKFQGDTATSRQALAGRAGGFEKIADAARAAGGIHHRFGPVTTWRLRARRGEHAAGRPG